MKAHLLIVDDDANTLASLSRAFRLAGHEATVCDNPVRALEMGFHTGQSGNGNSQLALAICQ
ncbi:MAG TPA: hypothetical protein VLT16_16875, partial [Candidatus Limnocylindrales bacterium]|nr:hypothetical protein [Candidatus Limnocylindrales bacterium]